MNVGQHSITLAMTEHVDRKNSLSRWWPALILLSIVPLLYPAVPPLTDLPAHMSRFLVQMDAGRSPDIARWYGFHWNLIPNLGTDLLAWVLEPVLGLEPTMKAIATLIVALQTAGYLLLSRAAHGRVQAPALFALPLAYGYPFQYGFINFTFATALATLAVALWISPPMAARPVLRWLVFCPIACVIWISHLAGWAILCVMIGCCELAARHERTGRLWKSVASGFIAASCLLLPQALSLLWPDAPAHMPSAGFFLIPEKLYFLANVLNDRWAVLDVGSALLLAALIYVIWRSRSFALHRGLALTAIVLFVLFWLMPAWVMGSFYADMRLTPTIFAMAVIAAKPKLPTTRLRWLALAGLAFFCIRLAGTTTSMMLWDKQFRQELAVLDKLPHGSQLVSFSAIECRPFVLQGRLRDMHIASFALTRRHAFANDQFALSGGQLLQIHNPAAGAFDRDPSSIQTGEPCQGSIPIRDSAAKVPAAIPHLWVVWHSMESHLPGWAVLTRSGNSVLYRRSPSLN